MIAKVNGEAIQTLGASQELSLTKIASNITYTL